MTDIISKSKLLEWLKEYRVVDVVLLRLLESGAFDIQSAADQDIKTAMTRELTDERVAVAAAYWLDASPHERWEPDGIILARYARHAMAEIDRLKAERRWISVKERLPDRNTPILIAANGRVYTATLFEANGIEHWSVNNRGNADDPSTKVERVNAKAITHWMPLPEPPEKEASGQ